MVKFNMFFSCPGSKTQNMFVCVCVCLCVRRRTDKPRPHPPPSPSRRLFQARPDIFSGLTRHRLSRTLTRAASVGCTLVLRDARKFATEMTSESPMLIFSVSFKFKNWVTTKAVEMTAQ